MTRQIMKGLFCVGILLLCCVEVTGQDYAEFTADRPGASTGPAVVGHRVIQLEQGIQYDGDGGAGTITFSNTLLRYGLFPRMEIRVSGDGFLYRPEDASTGYKAAFSGLGLGAKISCFKCAIPSSDDPHIASPLLSSCHSHPPIPSSWLQSLSCTSHTGLGSLSGRSPSPPSPSGRS